MGGVVGLALGALEVPVGQVVVGSLGEVLTAPHGQAFCWSTESIHQEPCPFNAL